MTPEIVRVSPTDDYKVYVYFEDGKTVCYDVKPLLDKEMFKPLQNREIFVNRCTILNETLAWDIEGNGNPFNCVDIAPDTLYSLESLS